MLNKRYLFAIILVLFFVSEYLLRDLLFNFTLTVVPKVQSYFPYYTPFAKIFTFIGTEKGTAIIILLVYNFSNIYQTFLLISLVSVCCFIGGVLKVIYLSPRPYMVEPSVSILGCEGGWGNPSNHAFCSTCLWLSIYQIYIKRNEEMKLKSKLPLLLLILLLIFGICTSRIYLGAHSINQVIFGFFLGLIVYTFMFYFIEIQDENPFQFSWILNKFPYFIVLISLLFGLSVLPFFLIKPDLNLVQQWNNVIDTKCPFFPEAKRFQNESVMSILSLGLILSAYIGALIDYKINYKSKTTRWAKYNFDMGGLSTLNCDLIGKKNPVEIKESYRWNNTGFGISVERLIAICLICGILYSPHYIISYDSHIFIVMALKISLPAAIVIFFLFSYGKKYCDYCGVTNDTKFGNFDKKGETNSEIGSAELEPLFSSQENGENDGAFCLQIEETKT